jgi:hypothetical protein
MTKELAGRRPVATYLCRIHASQLPDLRMLCLSLSFGGARVCGVVGCALDRAESLSSARLTRTVG